MKRVMAKLGNMRKAEDFVVYPRATNATPEDDKVIIQSSHRICEFHTTTRQGKLSAYRSGGAYFIDLYLNATPVELPQTLVDEILSSQPHSGDVIGSSPVCGVIVA